MMNIFFIFINVFDQMLYLTFVLLLGYYKLGAIADFFLGSLSSKIVGSSSSKIVRPLFVVNMFFTVFD